MTITRRWRRITLHFSHIGLTLGRTFTSRPCLSAPAGLLPAPACLSPTSYCRGRPGRTPARWPDRLLVAVGDPPPAQVVGRDLHLHLSPGRMRIRCILIFPELWASTLWPFSSSTRNIAFGSGSTTVPSSTIASSLGLGRWISLNSLSICPPGRADVRSAHCVVRPHRNRGHQRSTTERDRHATHNRGQPNDQFSPGAELPVRPQIGRGATFGTQEGRSGPEDGEHLRTVLGDGDGVLEVGRQACRRRSRRSSRRRARSFRPAGVDHRLDREDHARLQGRAAAPGQ